MKIILSRKGFDSSFGGVPSLIRDDGTMLSAPIQEMNEKGVFLTQENVITIYRILSYRQNANINLILSAILIQIFVSGFIRNYRKVGNRF